MNGQMNPINQGMMNDKHIGQAGSQQDHGGTGIDSDTSDFEAQFSGKNGKRNKTLDGKDGNNKAGPADQNHKNKKADTSKEPTKNDNNQPNNSKNNPTNNKAHDKAHNKSHDHGAHNSSHKKKASQNNQPQNEKLSQTAKKNTDNKPKNNKANTGAPQDEGQRLAKIQEQVERKGNAIISKAIPKLQVFDSNTFPEEAKELLGNIENLYQTDKDFKSMLDQLINNPAYETVDVSVNSLDGIKSEGNGVIGLGTIGGNSFAIDPAAINDPEIIAHEFGHNIGLDHGQKLENLIAATTDKA